MSAAIAAAAPGAEFTPAADATPRHPSLLHYAVAVLSTADALEKTTLTAEANHFFHAEKLPIYIEDNDSHPDAFPRPPSKPARPAHLQTLPPREMPQARKGVEHHNWNKMRLIHSLCHIESYAIDLSWDILVRFATKKNEGTEQTEGVAMPRDFYADWLRIAAEEAKHFLIWNTRLQELNFSYGSLPVHDGLWQSADETSHSLLARLAVVHAVHEARGLDQAPKMLQQLNGYGDKDSMRLLQVIEKDELTHVSSALTWFKFICNNHQPEPLDAIPKFHAIVRENFRGNLLPPFNTEARAECGFTEEWYLPLAVKREKPQVAPAAAAAEEAKKEEEPKKAEAKEAEASQASA